MRGIASAIVLALACLKDNVNAVMTEASYFYNAERPLVVAHRGSPGHFPEHSIAGYTDAYFGGADYIELDL
jgi:glycerophosphoryl diester phosphodiesterase